MNLKKIKSIIDGNPPNVLKLKFKKIFQKKSIIKYNKNINVYDIPIIINNRNRLLFLREQLNWFEKNKFNNIIILDNQSTYLPLIEFYEKIKYQVIRFNKNYGYLSLWISPLKHKFINNFYIYTDPDIVPISECPGDVINYFYKNLIKFNDIDKIGFGLKIDDINIDNKDFIIKNENKFWTNKYKDTNFYIAPIDTTFALYKPYRFGGYWLNSLRSDFPYLANHLPWYLNTNDFENDYYLKDIDYKSSFYQNLRGKNYL